MIDDKRINISVATHAAFGTFTLAATDQKIRNLEFGGNLIPSPTPKSSLILQALKWLEAYFNGLPVDPFPMDRLDLSAGTNFEQKVWKALWAIPYGKIVSYAHVAKIIDHPKAYQAVGQANHRNPLPIFIPCHRVLGSHGQLGGYAPGIHYKKLLLKLEGVR